MTELESIHRSIDTTSNVLYLRVGLWQSSSPSIDLLTPLVMYCISGWDCGRARI